MKYIFLVISLIISIPIFMFFKKQEIKKEFTIALTVQLTNSNGDTILSVSEEEPFSFITGDSTFFIAAQAKIKKLKANDTFAFVLSAKDAYGERDPALANLMAKTEALQEFAPNGEVKVGQWLSIKNELWKGRRALVTDVIGGISEVDFNSPFAGYPIYMSGKVIRVQNIENK